MSEHTELTVSLNNAIAYSWVLGWYAGRDGSPTDAGKIMATEKIKEMHPDIIRACNAHKDLRDAGNNVLGVFVGYVEGSIGGQAIKQLEAAIAKTKEN